MRAIALAAVAALSTGPAAAQENPFLEFWFGGFGGSGSGSADARAAGTPGLDPAIRAPRHDVSEAEWEDPFDPTGAGVFNDEAPQPVDMHNTVPILSDRTIESVKLAIARYRQIVEHGGWPAIAPGEELQVGVRGPRVVQLRERLMATGDLRQQDGQPDAFDSFVYQALVRFQRRNGLRPSGRLDERTLNALNVPARARLEQLEINLGRLTEMRDDLADRFVMVNIPGAEIEAVDNGVVESRHRTVVGKLDRPTPLVKSHIVELNFYPYWHVPESIVRRDLVPLLQKDPEYLTRTNLRVFTDWGYQNEVDGSKVDWFSPEALNLKFRQDPGDGNALGFVKINFPNPHAVYLHDTPKRSLFGQELRADSSGCVRIQNVDALVAWLLEGQDDWDAGKVQQVIQAGQSRDVALERKVALYMIYITAWATEDGTVHFRRDLYGRDGVGRLAANY